MGFLGEKDEQQVYYATDTNNKSFLEMSKFLKMAGVKNNLFMLAQSRKLPDPYSKDLGYMEKNMIKEECKKNIWYFLREVVRIPYCKTSSIQFQLNPANMAMIYFLVNGCDIYEVGCREVTNKTTTVLLYLLWKRQTRIFAKGLYDIRSKMLQLQRLIPEYIIDDIPGIILNQEKIKDFCWYDDAESLKDSILKKIETGINTSNVQFVITTAVGKNDNKHFATLRHKYESFHIEMYENSIFCKSILLEFNSDAMGMSEQWKDDMLKSLNNDKAVYDREILLKRDEKNEQSKNESIDKEKVIDKEV